MKKLITIIVYALSIGLGIYIGLSDALDYLDGSAIIISLLAFIICMYITILIHELGHLVCGLITGYTFLAFRISSITLAKIDGKLCFKRFYIPGTGGQCLLVPPPQVEGKIPFTLYTIGGSLFNFLFSILFLFVGYSTNFTLSFVSFLFLILGYTGAYIGLANIVPLRIGLIQNDGLNLLEMKKNNAAMHSFWLQLKHTEFQFNGIRAKDIDTSLFIPLIEDDYNYSLATAIDFIKENYYMDNHDFDKTNTLIDFILQGDKKILPLQKTLLLCDKIFIELLGNTNKETINLMEDKKFKNTLYQLRYNITVIRTQYAYNMLHTKNSKLANKNKKLFEKLIKISPFIGETESEKELMKLIIPTNNT